MVDAEPVQRVLNATKRCTRLIGIAGLQRFLVLLALVAKAREVDAALLAKIRHSCPRVPRRTFSSSLAGRRGNSRLPHGDTRVPNEALLRHRRPIIGVLPGQPSDVSRESFRRNVW